MTTEATPTSTAKSRLPTVGLQAATLFFVDALWLNQGVISALVCAWLLFVSLPRAFLAAPAIDRRTRLASISTLVAAALLVFTANWLNNRIAQARAETLVAAIKTFKQTNGRYPASLQALVPEFIDHVPVAKYTIAFNDFKFISSDDQPSLLYMAFPPFGRPAFNFKGDRWEYLD